MSWAASASLNLGFERCLVASSNLKGWKRPEGMEVIGVGGLEAARDLALGES